jgi:hypothetical protein
MSHDIQCWKCGAPLSHLALPFGRQECCGKCGADLHCCRLCGEFEPRLPQQCREPTVEEVRNKERANFCDHYRPVKGAWRGDSQATAEAARSELDRLFGK